MGLLTGLADAPAGTRARDDLGRRAGARGGRAPAQRPGGDRAADRRGRGGVRARRAVRGRVRADRGGVARALARAKEEPMADRMQTARAERSRRASAGARTPAEPLEEQQTGVLNGRRATSARRQRPGCTGVAAKVVGTALAAGSARSSRRGREGLARAAVSDEPREHVGRGRRRSRRKRAEPRRARESSVDDPEDRVERAHDPKPPRRRGATAPRRRPAEGARRLGGEAADVVRQARSQLEALLGIRRRERVGPRALPTAAGPSCWKWWRWRASRNRPTSSQRMSSCSTSERKLASVNRVRRYRRSQVDEAS